MSQFGDCHIRVADLQVSVLGASDLTKLWDGQDISARRKGCVAGASRIGTCEGYRLPEPVWSSASWGDDKRFAQVVI
jgi:hypothetical protein